MLEWETSDARKPFKFSNVITKIPQFIPTVESCWGRTQKELKPMLRALGRDQLEDLLRRTKEAHDHLCKRQRENLIDPTSQNMEE